jgi:hypothetical protein
MADDENYAFYMFNIKDKDAPKEKKIKVEQSEARLPPLPYPLRTSDTILEPRDEIRLMTKENVTL